MQTGERSQEAQEKKVCLERYPWGLKWGLGPVSRQWGGWSGETEARATVPSGEGEGPVERAPIRPPWVAKGPPGRAVQ